MTSGASRVMLADSRVGAVFGIDPVDGGGGPLGGQTDGGRLLSSLAVGGQIGFQQGGVVQDDEEQVVDLRHEDVDLDAAQRRVPPLCDHGL